MLDLPNPDPAPVEYVRDEPGDGEVTAEPVEWTDSRRVCWWITVIGYDRLQQCNECELTYPCTARSATRSSMCGDHRSPFADESPAMIAVAEPSGA